jgi:uncharacterized protein YllA (UPF0747 family)
MPIDSNDINSKMHDAIMGKTTGQGLWSQITQNSANVYDPFKTVSISADEKEYLETVALAADLLAGQVISPQDFFKLKLLLKSKDEEVRNAGIIFLNQKAKL